MKILQYYFKKLLSGVLFVHLGYSLTPLVNSKLRLFIEHGYESDLFTSNDLNTMLSITFYMPLVFLFVFFLIDVIRKRIKREKLIHSIMIFLLLLITLRFYFNTKFTNIVFRWFDQLFDNIVISRIILSVFIIAFFLFLYCKSNMAASNTSKENRQKNP